MKHFIVVAFIMLFCFAVLPEFFITDKVGEGTGKENVKQIEIINNESQNNLNDNQKNKEKIMPNSNNETKANANANVKTNANENDVKIDENKAEKGEMQKTEPLINEYVIEEDGKRAKQASGHIIQKNNEVEANKNINNNIKEEGEQANENKILKNTNCEDCECDSEQNCENSKNLTEKVDNKCNNEDCIEKSENVGQSKIDNQGNSNWLKNRKEEGINGINFNNNSIAIVEDEQPLPKIGLYQGGPDNKVADFSDVTNKKEEENEKQLAQKNLPIEDKMLNEHKQERAKKEVPGTSKIVNTKKLDLKDEQPIYDVELLGIIDNATVIMQDGIVNVKVGA